MERFRLTPMQETMLLESLSSPSRYRTTLCYELTKDIDTRIIEKRLDRLAERHEALRTRFVRDDDGVFWQEVGETISESLFQIKVNAGYLSITFHHALLDGWSISVILRELLSENVPKGKATPFRYYMKWLESRRGDLKWWKEYLGGAETCTNLPNAKKTDEYERRELHFRIETSGLLRQRARELRMTAGRLLQAVWSMLIARYNGGHSVVCTVNAGRSAPVPGVTGMVGMCVNTLPICTRLPAPPESVSFADWVSEWSGKTSEAEKHSSCNLGDLINGGLSHLLSIDTPPGGDGYRLVSSGAELVTDFDAVFTLGDSVSAVFAYNGRVYSDEVAAAIQGHFLTALNAVLKNPQIQMEQIPILTDAEISMLTALHDDDEILSTIERQTVIDFWHESAEMHSNRTALVCGDVRVTYAALSEKANILARALRAKGVCAEAPVAILLPRSERYVIAELAVWLAGGFFVPLDMEWPEDRIKTILAEICTTLVIDEDTYSELLTLNCQLSIIHYPLPNSAAYMIMTSGTSGNPKGVVATHRNFSNFCLLAKKRYSWKTGDACAMVLGFGFDGSMWDIWLPLISGGTLHVLKDDKRFNIRALGDYCRTERITHIDLPVALADSFRGIYRGENTLPDLRVMVTGGEEVRSVIPAEYPLSNEYGPTECTVCCSASWLNENDSPITVGSPPPNMHAVILDNWGRLCPDGVIGEACFSGVQVARGYYNAPELTAERFVENPFANGNPNHETLYRTGDLMNWTRRNGKRELVFKGRADRQVKLNGFRIELGEIESVLRAYPGVVAAVACIWDDRLCAYASGDIDAPALDAWLAAKLPLFMRPALFVVSEIPLTTSGKVDYKKLPMPGAENASKPVKPSTEAERNLVSAVSRILGAENTGTNHSYISLGGNSINAMRIVFSLERDGWLLAAKELITSGSLAEAAARMLPAAEAREERPQTLFTPLPAQEAMVFLSETESPDMYMVALTLAAPELTPETLEQRLDRAAGLHDILRTVFERDEQGRLTGRVGDAPSPLLQAMLDSGELILRYSHALLDGYSVNLLLDELLLGKFPETAPSFAAFAGRLAAQIKEQASDETWWRECPAEIVPILPAKNVGKPKMGRIMFCSAELMSKCAETAQRAGVTHAAFLLAAWGVVLDMFYAEDSAFYIPFVASCRDDDALMGMCAATRPLRFIMEGGSYASLARSVQDAMLHSMEHFFVPQDIIGRLPRYLFVFEDGGDDFTAIGEQDYDLVIKCAENGELIYNAACLPEERAHRIAARLNAALTAALDDRISVFEEGEYEKVTQTFAHGRGLEVKHKTAAEAFMAAAKLFGERTVLETESGTLTYAELDERAKRHADALNAHGIEAGDIVPCCPSRDAEGVIEQLSIVLSGAAFCPLDPAWPEARRRDIMCETDNTKVPPDSAYVLYTSGTTGRPKGVILPQRALANQVAWAIDTFQFSPDDKVLHYVSFTFDPSVWTIFTALCSGATLCLLPECKRLDPDAAARYISEHNITVCVLPAAVAPEILRRVPDSRLRLVFLGGEAPKNLLPRTDKLQIINCYGPTEACVNTTFYRIPPHETETRVIGKPVANTSVIVLNKRGGLCPVGVQGEVHIGGVQLAHGYLNRPEETAAAFMIHPRFGRLYKTGDHAAWNEDGTLTFLGRGDGQIKIRGNRVELIEIEQALCALPEISDAKVKFSDGVLDAYVIGQSDAIDLSAIRQKLSESLPSYMLPRLVTKLSALPLTSNGKVDTATLPDVSQTAVAARDLTETEKSIASAWRTAIKLPADYPISPEDSFSELGGHSLLLFHVVGLLAKSGVSVDIRTLIEHPVLSDLAQAIGNQKATDAPKPSVSPAAGIEAYKRYLRDMETIDLSRKRSLNHILITGGTGFLGSHLIREFFKNTAAVIHLPVRGDPDKLTSVLTYYFGAQAEGMLTSERIRVYACDISEKPPHPDAPLDAIYHTAADIRHYAPEDEMIRANVTATENMLELARQYSGALFAHVSTTSAVNAPIIYETDTDLGPPFDNIYQRTKQTAERLVLAAGERGLKYAVFRIGHISPGYESGSVARNFEINAMLRLLHAMLLTELLPEQDYKIGFGYADKTARALRLLTEPAALKGKIYHIDNPNAVRLSEIFRLGGYAGTVLPVQELTSRLRLLTETNNAPVRQAAAEYLGRLTQGGLEKESADIVAGEIMMDATLSMLERLGFTWPHLTAEYVKTLKNVKVWS